MSNPLLGDFEDFRSQLAAAIEWPDHNADVRVDARAERWADEIALSVGAAVRAGFPISWKSDPDGPGDHEARKVLELAREFEELADRHSREWGPRKGRELARSDARLQKEYTLRLERVLFRTPEGQQAFREAVLSAAAALWPNTTKPVTARNKGPQQTRRDQDQPGMERLNDILTAIRAAGTPLQMSEIVQALQLPSEGKLPANLAWMCRNNYLENIPQQGYWPKNQANPSEIQG